MSVSIIDQNYALRLPTLQNNMPPPKLMVKENSFHIPNPNLSSCSKYSIPGLRISYLSVRQKFVRVIESKSDSEYVNGLANCEIVSL